MKISCICVYGETCTGKSTLGKYLNSVTKCSYVSFGDLKRQEITKGTLVGVRIRELLALGCPLPAELGFSVIKSAIVSESNIISGYPISIDEFDFLSKHISVVGILVLTVDEMTLIRRFGLRRECPECHIPGTIGDVCHVHNVAMVPRSDASLEELISRRRLYKQRIMPFLASGQVGTLPRLDIDCSLLTKEEVASQTTSWMKKINYGGV